MLGSMLVCWVMYNYIPPSRLLLSSLLIPSSLHIRPPRIASLFLLDSPPLSSLRSARGLHLETVSPHTRLVSLYELTTLLASFLR